jgi:rhamnose transport system ATP-binding protein
LTRKEQRLLYGVVRRLKSQGVGVVYISHRLEEIFELADRVTVLRDGESVGTFPVKPAEHPGADRALSESELIRLMVGREVSDIYPPAASALGGVVLELQGLGCASVGVRDVTLDLREGEIVGLAGLVGAGRTELARVLFGLNPADAGCLRFEGREVRVSSPAAAIELGIAYVPEDRRRHGVILDMSVANNMSMAILPRLFPWSWIRADAETRLALDWMRDLNVRAGGPDAAGGSLSGGNQQKVALTRWLATRPKVLILDEPTQGVDVGAKSQIHKIIRKLAFEGMAVLMISSDLPEIIGMCDRIAVMRGGTLRAVLPGGTDAHDLMAAALGQGGGQNHGEA